MNPMTRWGWPRSKSKSYEGNPSSAFQSEPIANIGHLAQTRGKLQACCQTMNEYASEWWASPDVHQPEVEWEPSARITRRLATGALVVDGQKRRNSNLRGGFRSGKIRKTVLALGG
jgi:hypothetical protein